MLTHYMVFVRDPEFDNTWQPCYEGKNVFISTDLVSAEKFKKYLSEECFPGVEYKIGEVLL